MVSFFSVRFCTKIQLSADFQLDLFLSLSEQPSCSQMSSNTHCMSTMQFIKIHFLLFHSLPCWKDQKSNKSWGVLFLIHYRFLLSQAAATSTSLFYPGNRNTRTQMKQHCTETGRFSQIFRYVSSLTEQNISLLLNQISLLYILASIQFSGELVWEPTQLKTPHKDVFSAGLGS